MKSGSGQGAAAEIYSSAPPLSPMGKTDTRKEVAAVEARDLLTLSMRTSRHRDTRPGGAVHSSSGTTAIGGLNCGHSPPARLLPPQRLLQRHQLRVSAECRAAAHSPRVSDWRRNIAERVPAIADFVMRVFGRKWSCCVTSGGVNRPRPTRDDAARKNI